jgi:hypothetical protein
VQQHEDLQWNATASGPKGPIAQGLKHSLLRPGIKIAKLFFLSSFSVILISSYGFAVLFAKRSLF